MRAIPLGSPWPGVMPTLAWVWWDDEDDNTLPAHGHAETGSITRRSSKRGHGTPDSATRDGLIALAITAWNR